MTKPDDIVGRGAYTLGQAARLLKLKPNSLKYWFKEHETLHSVVSGDFSDEGILSFAQLMELHFVKMFRDAGVSFQYIRRAANTASRQFHVKYPFTVKRFDTDGKAIFATLKSKESNKILVEDLEKGQLVFRTVIKPFFKKLDYGASNDIERFWPLKQSGRIVLDPTKRFGQPIDAETGMSTRAIVDAVGAGDGQDVKSVAKWFDIPVEAVKAAIKFEKSLAS